MYTVDGFGRISVGQYVNDFELHEALQEAGWEKVRSETVKSTTTCSTYRTTYERGEETLTMMIESQELTGTMIETLNYEPGDRGEADE